MGLILDSSVVIAAERRGDTVEQLIEKIVKATGDQEAALSAIGLTELIHGRPLKTGTLERWNSPRPQAKGFGTYWLERVSRLT